MKYFVDTELRTEEITNYEKPHSLFRRIGTLVLSALLIVSALYFASTPPALFPKDSVVTISEGQTLKDIASMLSTKGYIKSKFLFVSMVTGMGGERSISPGDYYFESPVSVMTISFQIAHGIHNVNQIKITIPEGQNNSEVANTISEKLPEFDVSNFLSQAKFSEGYLFPETYYFYASATIEDVISSMKQMFKRKTDGLFDNMSESEIKKVLTLASLVEREAQGTDDRALIAGILTKRLSLKMPLQVDATVAYANGVEEKDLVKSHFKLESPYNTYVVLGLPPSPIANPGLPAIQAALNPAQTSYLYYLHDKRGNIHYGKTYKEHLANIARYLR